VRNKKLGMGLKDLLDLDVKTLFGEAIRLDEAGKIFQAYHLYMKISEIDRSPTASKAFNNAAIILAENGFIKDAIALLEHAVSLDPDSEDVKRNLEVLRGDSDDNGD